MNIKFLLKKALGRVHRDMQGHLPPSDAGEALDNFLREVNAANSDAEMREIFSSFRLNFDTDLPTDPFSSAYRQRQMELYLKLHGKQYQVTNESTPFDSKALAVKPFPYLHESAALVGDQLMGIGFLIKAMNLPSGSRILEFGPGWGNTSIALAKMGYHVTAIDVEPNFVDLLVERARLEGISTLDARVGQFFDVETLEAHSFDAILFYECFHHCDDHLRLIAGFDRVLATDGLVCFAAEPILDDFPIPWGLRMDGESLWAISKNGWMELGFQTDYFQKALGRFGWISELVQGQDSPLACLRIARRVREKNLNWNFSGMALGNQVGERSYEGVKATGISGYLMHGPYATVAAGRYDAVVTLDRCGSLDGEITVDVVSKGATFVHAQQSIRVDACEEDRLTISFELTTLVSDLEVRVLSVEASGLMLKALSIVPLVDEE